MVESFGTIGVLGGTGALGKGLAYRLAKAGLDVVIGSRSEEKGQSGADDLKALIGPDALLRGMDNAATLAASDIVVLAIPYDGHAELVGALPSAGDKIVVSAVNPLGFDKSGPFGLEIEDKSAAEEAARLLPGSRMVGAFHHLAAGKLLSDDSLAEQHVLVCSDDAEAKAVVCSLAKAITGSQGIDAGRLRMARQLEPFTAVLISVNKAYGTHSGVSLTGL